MFFGFLSVIRSFYFSRTNLYRATEGVKTLWRQKWASPDKKDFIVLWMLEGQKPSDVNYSDVMSIERMLKLKNRKKWRGHISPPRGGACAPSSSISYCRMELALCVKFRKITRWNRAGGIIPNLSCKHPINLFAWECHIS